MGEPRSSARRTAVQLVVQSPRNLTAARSAARISRAAEPSSELVLEPVLESLLDGVTSGTRTEARSEVSFAVQPSYSASCTLQNIKDVIIRCCFYCFSSDSSDLACRFSF